MLDHGEDKFLTHRALIVNYIFIEKCFTFIYLILLFIILREKNNVKKKTCINIYFLFNTFFLKIKENVKYKD